MVKKQYKCVICNNDMNRHNIFCSRNCANIHNWNIKKENIYKNNGIGNFSIKTIKKYIIDEHGYKCSICNNTEWNNQPIPLVLDHINGRAADNNLENLRLVCGNCDMQLPTYKSKNKNSDRKRIGKYI